MRWKSWRAILDMRIRDCGHSTEQWSRDVVEEDVLFDDCQNCQRAKLHRRQDDRSPYLQVQPAIKAQTVRSQA